MQFDILIAMILNTIKIISYKFNFFVVVDIKLRCMVSNNNNIKFIASNLDGQALYLKFSSISFISLMLSPNSFGIRTFKLKFFINNYYEKVYYSN